LEDDALKMIIRWFPYNDDSVKLEYIKQTPGITGVAACLPKIPVGEVWGTEIILDLKKHINNAGLEMEVIESVNVHEDIKKGLPERDRYIQNYIDTIKNLSAAGVKCICYNFMPVLDWLRSDLALKLPDGSYVMSYRHDKVLDMDPKAMGKSMLGKSEGFSLPGWEPERFDEMAKDIAYYQNVSEEDYLNNMRYFLSAVIPVAEEYDVRMAIHPDDPPWTIFGLPKIITSVSGIRKFLSLYDSPYNGLTFCTGSLGANCENDIPSLAREFADRIPFAHLRNVKHLTNLDFDECAHLSSCGDLDMFEITKALYEGGFNGYIRPDHGRMIWDEVARPGYGLYDRALGASYLQGIWESLEKAVAAKPKLTVVPAVSPPDQVREIL
jgi:mannonate dehydratase